MRHMVFSFMDLVHGDMSTLRISLSFLIPELILLISWLIGPWCVNMTLLVYYALKVFW